MNRMPRQSPCAVVGLWTLFILGGVASSQTTAVATESSLPRSQTLAMTGFLFINGQYVASPYAIEMVDQTLTINGTQCDYESFDLSRYERRDRSGDRWGGREGRGRRNRDNADAFGYPSNSRRPERDQRVALDPMIGLYNELQQLQLGAIIVLSDSRKPIQFWVNHDGQPLLESLVDSGQLKSGGIEFPAEIQFEEDKETWRQLVSSFQPSPRFVEEATQALNRLDDAETSNSRQSFAFRLSEKILYPLTTFALLLVVIAVGHLMAHAQRTFAETLDAEGNQEMGKVVVRSLVILALMSTIDLVWTLIAHQNGSMRELNPIGSKLINDPATLIAFKIGVTSLSVGLLYWLRHLPLTRKAAWWCCLVLTLLTARWLTFHSMLV